MVLGDATDITAMRLGALALMVGKVSAHGMMSFPPPRNALDRVLAPWNGTVPAFPIPFDHPNWCAAPVIK